MPDPFSVKQGPGLRSVKGSVRGLGQAKGAQPRAAPAVGVAWPWRLWPIGLLALLTVGFCLPMLVSSCDQRIAGPDITKYFQWIHQYTRDCLRAGRVPLWNPYNYAGMPFAANPQCSVFYPPSWLILLMPVIEAHKWLIAGHVLLAGAGMYAFLRRIGLGQAAGIIGSLPWMFGGYVFANAAVGHLTMLFTMAWVAWIVYAYERAAQGGGRPWLVWTGCLLGAQLLAGEPQNSYYTVLLLTLYALIRPLGGASPVGQPADELNTGAGRRITRVARFLFRWAGGLALVGAVAAVTAAIQLLPTAELAVQSDRAKNTYAFVTSMSYGPGSLLGYLLSWSQQFSGVRCTIQGHKYECLISWELACYAGVLTLVLAGVSLAVRGRPPLRAARVVLLVGLILMLGRYTPVYYWLYKALPGLRLFRIPARAIVMANWALSVMAAYGAERLLEGVLRGWQARRWRAISTGLLVLVTALLVGSYPHLRQINFIEAESSFKTGDALNWFSPPLLKAEVALLLTVAVVIALGWLPKPAAAASMVAVLAVDLLLARPAVPLEPYNPEQDIGLQRFRELARVASEEHSLFRADIAPSHAAANAAMAARVENVNGYWPVALRRFYHFVHYMRGIRPAVGDRHELRDELYSKKPVFHLRVLNGRYLSSGDLLAGKLELVQDKNCPPRAWLVERAEMVDDQGALNRLRDREFYPGETVLLDHPASIQMTPGDPPVGSCSSFRRDDGGLEITARTARPCYLVMSHVFYPGWRARVDGRDVPLERADYLISVVPLPAGAHQVILQYHPLSFRVGVGLTVAACIGMLVLAWGSATKKPGGPGIQPEAAALGRRRGNSLPGRPT